MPLDIDRHANLQSPLARWDPRIKIFSLTLFIFCVALLKTIPMSLVALACALIIMALSRLPIEFIAHGIKWVCLFLLPFLIVMPLSYPGDPAFHILGLPFAWEGLRLAVSMIIKAIAIVGTAYAMFGTSRFDVSMIALQRLKCPKILVQMLLFTYRYLFVFLAEMQRMDTAMAARGFVRRADYKTLKITGDFVGTLLVRSFERTERIYKAMLSKGYTGEFHTLLTFQANRTDFIKAALVSGCAITLIVSDYAGFFHIAEQGWY